MATVQQELESMEPDHPFTNWILTGVAATVSTLVAGLVGLWKLNESKNAKDIAELKAELVDCRTRIDECESDRVDLRVRLAQLEAAGE